MEPAEGENSASLKITLSSLPPFTGFWLVTQTNGQAPGKILVVNQGMGKRLLCLTKAN